MTYHVRLAPEAAAQLKDLHGYISGVATPDIAAGYVNSVIEHCEGLAVFPHRGTSRDDLRPGLRTTS